MNVAHLEERFRPRLETLRKPSTLMGEGLVTVAIRGLKRFSLVNNLHSSND